MSVNKLLAVIALLLLPVSVFGKAVTEWDFSRGLHGWTGNNKVVKLTYSPEGLLVKSTGDDPWIEGPAIDLPGDKTIRVKIRMKSNADASAELFYGPTFRAGHSAQFSVRNDGKWHDYSTTHFAKHANGIAGGAMVAILEGATLSGDKELIAAALELLDKQTVLYADTVPRGAQTWEIPLHTPDILASAHMVKAYALGYIISGREEYLEQARYWAWTGVPFVYLHPPTSQPVGSYSTIAVLGATNWKAPLWLGQPVQWCGLVYGSALHLLSECDPQGPWEKIANGITMVGLQMTWRRTDVERQGLLPDYFDLRGQVSGGPAINPGTVQAHLAELYGEGTIYDMKKLPQSGWFVHAPCAISDIDEEGDSVTLATDGWGDKRYYVLISGIGQEPRKVSVRKVGEDSNAFESATRQFDSRRGILVVTLQGKSQIKVE